MSRDCSTQKTATGFRYNGSLSRCDGGSLLRASRSFIHTLSNGAVHKTVYVPTVKAFHVCIPSLPEQRGIVQMLSEQLATAERLVAAADAEVTAIDALSAAILRRAFSGEI